jgi:hypothetical protein
MLVYPLDTLKNRMMMYTCGLTKRPALAIALMIFRQETLGSLYKGITMSFLQLIPMSFVMSIFQKYRQEEWEKKCSNAIKVEGTAVPPSEEDLQEILQQQQQNQK